MPEPQEYERSAALLRHVAAVLYGSRNPQGSITLEDLYNNLGVQDTLAVDSVLKKMESRELLSLDLRGSRIGLLGHGKTSFERNCIAEMVLGRDYTAKKYSAAIVHIIVEGGEGSESGGTGFFSADPPNAIITAAHVVRERGIIRIEDTSGREITLRGGRTRWAAGDLDLATVECEMPTGIEPIRVEWDPKAASPGAELVVFGYPRIAFHLPGLYQSRAELHTILKRYPSLRDSLIISSTTHPGCSGGPVLDLRGFAIGVIEQENITDLRTGANAYFNATPAHYLKELV